METNGYFVQAWEALSPLAEIRPALPLRQQEESRQS
jgi:hypothetical protein